MKQLFCHRLLTLAVLALASALLLLGGNLRGSIASPRTIGSQAEGSPAHSTIGNPAAVHCRDLGYDYRITGDNGKRGVCILPDGKTCDAWEFLQGKCGRSYSYCAQQGYRTETVTDGRDPFSQDYAVCVGGDGTVMGSVTGLLDLSERASGCGGATAGGERPSTFAEEEAYVPPTIGDPPASFDWRNEEGHDWMTPIKDQGGCGSCWAFNAVAIAESAHNIAHDDPNLDKDLSEQYLVSDCSTAGECCGGWHGSALTYIRDSGIPDEGCLPYVDGNGCSCDGGTCDGNCTYRTGDSCSDRTCSDRCTDWSTRLQVIDSVGSVSSDPRIIKQTLIDTGPLAAAMGIGSTYGGYWDGDIYRCGNDDDVNHGVVIVGYDDAGGYWWARNSWGTGWGEDGYFKLGYGECRIQDYVYYADVTSACWADLDGDGDVTVADIQLVASLWRQPAGPPYDVDGDGLVTVVDIMMVAAEWGPCP